jgi:hypothetical protein
MTHFRPAIKGHNHRRFEAYYYPSHAPDALRSGNLGVLGAAGQAVVHLLWLSWRLVTLPFHLLFSLIGLLGRFTGMAIGFTCMVVGAALCAGPFFIIGIPMFIVGLLVTLRCLG